VVLVVSVALVLVVVVVSVLVVMLPPPPGIVVVVVVVGQLPGTGASLRRNVLSSLPSLTSVPPNSVQYCSVFRVVTTATGDMLPVRSMASWLPLQMAFASTPFFTSTMVHVVFVVSLYL